MTSVMSLVTDGAELLPLAEKATSLTQVKRTKLLEKHYLQTLKSVEIPKAVQATPLTDEVFQRDVYARVTMSPNIFYLLRLGGKKYNPITYKIGITSRNASLRKTELQTGQHGKVTVLLEKDCNEDGLNRAIEDLLKQALAELKWTGDGGGTEVFVSSLPEDQVIKGIAGFVNDVVDNGIGDMNVERTLAALGRYGFRRCECMVQEREK
jgi:hypothetical protein